MRTGHQPQESPQAIPSCLAETQGAEDVTRCSNIWLYRSFPAPTTWVPGKEAHLLRAHIWIVFAEFPAPLPQMDGCPEPAAGSSAGASAVQSVDCGKWAKTLQNAHFAPKGNGSFPEVIFDGRFKKKYAASKLKVKHRAFKSNQESRQTTEWWQSTSSEIKF